MLRRVLLALIAVALVATAVGCGSKSSSSGSGLDDALTYVPKNAPIVVAINTDAEGDQWQQVDDLIAKFPFGGTIKGQIKSAFSARAGIDYDQDVKPLLGNDFVVALLAPPPSQGSAPYVVAWKVKDEDAARKLLERDSTKAGSVDGADLYTTKSGNATALKDSTVVSASTQGDLKAALARAGTDDHMTADDFNAALGDLDKDSLVRVTGNLQALIESPKAAAARKVPWVAALRTFGVALSAQEDGIQLAFDVKTEGDLTDAQLPFASGADAASVIRRGGEVGFGIRNPAQTIKFGEMVAQITDPAGYAKFQAQKAKGNKRLGIDIDKDVFGQLTGNAETSVSLDRQFAVRADLADPAAAEQTLKKAVPRLAKSKGKAVGISTPKNGKGFYGVARPNGKKVVFGVVGKSLILATDAARAAQFAGESPSTVSGTKGSLVMATDARALANAIAAQTGQGAAVQIVTGALGDLVGSVETETSGLTGTVKLFIR